MEDLGMGFKKNPLEGLSQEARADILNALDPRREGLFRRREDGAWCVDIRFRADSAQYKLIGPRSIDLNLSGPDVRVLSDEAVQFLTEIGKIVETTDGPVC